MMNTELIAAPVIRESFADLASQLSTLPVAGHKAMIVGDTNTIPLFGETVRDTVSGVFSFTEIFAFEAGEEHKNLQSVQALLAALIDLHYDRGDCIIAVGGGVTGDMAGFAAAIYLRGITVIQVPTTLLAQIDSSIGGKTGVDFDGYKNMIGAFKMPALIYTNTAALASLPEDQFRAGMGEVVKTALLADASLCTWLLEHAEDVRRRDPDVLCEMISRCAMIKTEIVRRDPTEKGERALLNLGHTIGHAIEKASDFRLLHGDCVSIGLYAAAVMSWQRDLLTHEELGKIGSLYLAFDLPAKADGMDKETLLRLTKSDKKMSKGQIRFILLKRLGEAIYTDDVTDHQLLEGIRVII